MRFARRREPTTVLTCPGVFTLQLPASWTVVSQGERLYELAPPAGGPDVALGISVHALTDDVRDDGTKTLLSAVAHAGGTPQHFTASTQPASSGDRSFGRWSAGGRTWFGGALFLGEFLVVATSHSAPGDDTAFTAGEQLVAAIKRH